MSNPYPQGYDQQQQFYGQQQYGQPAQGYGPQQYGPPMYYPPPKRKKPWLLIVGLIVGIPLLIVIGIAGLAVLFMATTKESTPSAVESESVLTVEDLEPYIEGYTAEPGAGSSTKIRYIDGSYDIEYEYEDDELYLSSTMTVEATTSDAGTTYSAQKIGSSIGGSFAEGDVELVKRNDIYSWGDESEFIILQSNGEPYGNIFTCRKGKRVFYVLWNGVYFDDPVWAADLLDPVMERAWRHK